MNAEQGFSLFNLLAMIGWLSLVILPKHKITDLLVHRHMLPALLAIIYAVVLLPELGASEGDLSSLEGVMTSFTNPWLLLGGWIHYLCFDLFLGGWEAREAKRLGIPHILMIPVLALALMMGPCGFLVFVMMRLFYERKLKLKESTA